MNLFDQTIENYIIKWEGSQEGILDAKIFSEKDEIIGQIKGDESREKTVNFCDSQSMPIISAKRRTFAWKTTYDVQSQDFSGIVEFPHGHLKKTVHFKTKGKTVLTLRSKRNFRQLNPPEEYLIMDQNETEIAEIIFSSEKMNSDSLTSDFYNTCSLKIITPTFDRKIIFSLFISFLIDFYHLAILPLRGNPSKKSQACLLVGLLSGLLSAVILVTSLGYIFENEITVTNPLPWIFLILIPAVISIGSFYLYTKV